MQQRSGLTANAVGRIMAVLPLASCSNPDGMTRTNAKVRKTPGDSDRRAESSTIGIHSRYAV